MSAHVSRMCAGAYFQLHVIAKIRHCLTVNACKTIVHALVTSKLDYGNAVLFGINERLINKLQMTQNSAAQRLILRQRRRDHITPVLIALDWLPIGYRIACAKYWCWHFKQSSAYEPCRQLRSTSRSLLTVPVDRQELFDKSKVAEKCNNFFSTVASSLLKKVANMSSIMWNNITVTRMVLMYLSCSSQ